MRGQWLLGSLAGTLVSALAGAQNFVEFPLPQFAYPTAITAGPDGNLWFTEYKKIGQITTAGVITEFPIPTSDSSPGDGIVAGPDGNLWFTESSGVFRSGKIGRITTTGVITEFPLALFTPITIAAGPDGNLWFTDELSNAIGRITTTGVVTQFQIPTLITRPGLPPSSGTSFIAAGPDGNLWFAETYGNKIGRITTAGVITEFPVPTAGGGPYGIAPGPDGNLWFTEVYGNKIGRITTTGLISEFPIPTSPSFPGGIVAGPDGNLWFTEADVTNRAKIGRITTTGVITEFPAGIPFIGSSITAGPDGNLWFTTGSGIGRISTMPDRLCLSENRFCVQVTWQAASQATGGGSGIASPITANTGSFWFFSPDNLDLVVKVLDGRSINGKFWVFYGSLTNVAFTLTVTDTQTGAVKTYINQQGQLTSVADTGAF